jgi:hypothetical protein
VANISSPKRAAATKGVRREDQNLVLPTVAFQNQQADSALTALPSRRESIFGDKRICGDLFSSGKQNLDGILYKSRTSQSTFGPSRLPEVAGEEGPADDPEDSDDGMLDKIYGFDEESDSEDDEEAASALSSRQRLALTLKNWCVDEANVGMILDEGAVATLVGLARSVSEDSKVRRYVAQAFFHLSEKPRIRKHLIEEGAMAALLSLSSSISAIKPGSKLMRDSLASGHFPFNCAAAICNLTLHDGGEARMVGDGADLALRLILSNEMATDPDSHISAICVQALFNLTCVQDMYDDLEKVIKVLIGIPVTPNLDARSITTSAACNCSNFFKLRARLLEAGALQSLNGVALEGDREAHVHLHHNQSDASRSVAYHAAVAFHNMATSRACRADMVLRGAVTSIVKVSHSDLPATLLVVAASLQKLTSSLDRPGLKRIISDGVILGLRNTVRFPACEEHASISREAAMALYNLSSVDDCVFSMVGDGAIQVLVELCLVADRTTKESCAKAFCNIVAIEEVHDIVLSSEALPSLFQLAVEVLDTSIIYALSVAFLNLSLGERTRGEAVNAGIVRPLVRFATIPGRTEPVLECCSAALSFLATLEANIHTMVEHGVLGALASMLSCGFPRVTARCAGALATIAYDHKSHDNLLQEGLLLNSVIGAATENMDPMTRESCCAVLASLSFTKAARHRMRQLQPIGAFVKIAKEDTTSTRRRCTTILCNLAVENDFREEMVKYEVPLLMSELSNTYSENTLRDCAKCLCNLSFDGSTAGAMVEQKVVETLMMICMVRSVSDETKLMCAKALLNLVSSETIVLILGTGIVHALAALSSQESEETMQICANLFNMITQDQEGRVVIASRSSTLKGLYSLMRSKNTDTQASNITKAFCEQSLILQLLTHHQIKTDKLRQSRLQPIAVPRESDGRCSVRGTPGDKSTRNPQKRRMQNGVHICSCRSLHRPHMPPYYHPRACRKCTRATITVDAKTHSRRSG